MRRLQPIKVPQSCALALIFPFVWLYAAVIWGAKAGTRRAVDHEWIEQQEKKYGIGG